MSVQRVIDLLNEAAAILEPFTAVTSPGTLVWNGSRYASGTDNKMDPYALAWWATISASVSLIDGQTELSAKQRDYIRRTFCSGMGSFNDFALDPRTLGPVAVDANKELDRIRALLHEAMS